MKRFLLLTVNLIFVSVSLAFAHHSIDDRLNKLALDLGLSAAERAHFNAYAGDLKAELEKRHQEFSAQLQKVLSVDQFEKFMTHAKAMKTNHQPMPKNDAEVQSMVERYSNYLLLTANEESRFEVLALKFHHQVRQIKNRFLDRLSRVLTSEQKAKLDQLKSTW